MQVEQIITWSDGQQTEIMNEAELSMLQYVLWDLGEEVCCELRNQHNEKA